MPVNCLVAMGFDRFSHDQLFPCDFYTYSCHRAAKRSPSDICRTSGNRFYDWVLIASAHVNTRHYPIVGRCWSIYCRAPALLMLVAFDRTQFEGRWGLTTRCLCPFSNCASIAVSQCRKVSRASPGLPFGPKSITQLAQTAVSSERFNLFRIKALSIRIRSAPLPSRGIHCP